jgi:uncharacterized membrane protein (DUF4010 family)
VTAAPSAINFGLLIGLSFFLGLAFEDFFAHSGSRRPGGVRTFPLLALAGGLLYLFEPTHLVPFTGGLVVLGAWLSIYYRIHIREHDEEGEPNVGLVALVLNLHAYILGPIALALPNWVAVGTTVAAVLFLTGRERLHGLARGLEIDEIVTAGQFLILTGIILPLLPNEPVTTLTNITPRHAWLALVVVCALSYTSYLAQRYWPPAAQGLWMAALGGLYSSTATTVVLARRAKTDEAWRGHAQAGITLATAIMYLRILAIVAVFNAELARRLLIPFVGLSLVALVICVAQYRLLPSSPTAPEQQMVGRNPLELGTAAIFAALFVVISLISTWVTAEFGTAGTDALAAVVGFADIDPFVLNLAQGGTSGISGAAAAAAIVIAASSNNLLKAGYASVFAGGRATATSAIALVGLAAAGVAIAIGMGMS